MFESILTGVATVVGASGIIFGVKWVAKSENRERLRQRFCAHQWQERRSDYGDGFIVLSPYAEECLKCGKMR